jgi:hypothetical protein
MGKRAERKMESLFIDRLNDLQGVDTHCTLPAHARSESQTWVFPHTQQELTVNAMSS